MAAPAFARYIGIDYSGAKTPDASLPGLRVYMAELDAAPVEVLPPRSPRRYWSRRGVAEWLAERMREDVPTLVGIDHGFSFPMEYFQTHGLAADWDSFLDDFQRHWPLEDSSVETVREGVAGNAAARQGNSRWRRLAERRAGGAKSVFHFDVQGSVAKSTHSGLPWLRFIRRTLGERVHFWPFDGWDIPEGRSAIAEVYPALWSRSFPANDRTPDQHDAFAIAAWMQQADADERLEEALRPRLSDDEHAMAKFEGWILGVPGHRAAARAGAPDMWFDPEKVAYWYFRLNGFLQIENFVVHPSGRGGQRTDADLIGVRFPHRAERLIDSPEDLMADDVEALGLTRDGIDFVIAEVKMSRCSLNGPWTERDDRNVDRVLAAIGCLREDQIEAAAADIYQNGVHRGAGNLRIRLVAVGRERNDDLARDYPGVTQLSWSDMLGFIWRRFRDYRQQKRQVQQWDDEGQNLKRFADRCREADEFVEDVMGRFRPRSVARPGVPDGA